jgi:hypothetical protein
MVYVDNETNKEHENNYTEHVTRKHSYNKFKTAFIPAENAKRLDYLYLHFNKVRIGKLLNGDADIMLLFNNNDSSDSELEYPYLLFYNSKTF